MKKILLSLLASGALAFGVQAQTFDWAYATGSAVGDFVEGAATDATGNLYVSGRFQNTVDFDLSGAGTTSLTSAGNSDIFIAKYSPAGALLWVKQIGSTLGDDAYKLVVDGSGNAYIAGAFEGTVDFDPNAGTQNLTAAPADNSGFLLKLNSDGDFAWVKGFIGDDYSYVEQVSLDNSGNILLLGYFGGTLDSDPNAATVNLTGPGPFAVKLDASGNFVYSHNFTGVEVAMYSTLDGDGNAYFTGGAYAQHDIDRAVGIQNEPAHTAFNEGFFIVKWNASGSFQWAKTVSGKNAFAESLLATSDGKIVAAGSFMDSIDIDPSATNNILVGNSSDNNALVLQLDATNGNLSWGQALVGSGNSYATTVARDYDNNLYIGGSYTGAIDFNGGAPSAVDSTAGVGSSAPFLLKVSASGGYLWHYAVTSTGAVSTTSPQAAVSVNAEHLYLVFSLSNDVPFPGTTLSTAGGFDFGIAKWSQTPINISVERTAFAAMQLFPNPSFDGRVNIQLGETSENLQATVFNALGQTISTQSLQNVEQLQVELPAAAGMYFIELRSQDGKSATLKAQRQ